MLGIFYGFEVAQTLWGWLFFLFLEIGDLQIIEHPRLFLLDLDVLFQIRLLVAAECLEALGQKRPLRFDAGGKPEGVVSICFVNRE